MAPWKEADRRVRQWGLVDYKLAQTATFLLALLTAKLVPKVLTIDSWWLVIGAVACAAKPIRDLFISRKTPPRQPHSRSATGFRP